MVQERVANLRATGIARRYGRRWVVQDVNLTLEPGIHGLLGNNGAGKTTVIKMLATVLPPSRGSVEYGPYRRPEDDLQIRQHLGYLPQQYGLLDYLSAREYLFYVCRMKGGLPHDEAFSPDLWLERMGLQDSANRRIGRLSGGMKQRLAIAQALMGHPSLVILDEPTAGLDPDERVRFRNLLQEVAHHAVVLLSTHIVSDVEHLAEHITIMHEGQIVAKGTTRELSDLARGRVFELTVSASEWEAQRAFWMERTGSHGVVANIAQEGNQVRVRLVTANPPPQAEAITEVGLEDGYLAATSLAVRP